MTSTRKSRARYTCPRATTHCHTELSYCTAPVSSVRSEALSVCTTTEASETSDRGGEVSNTDRAVHYLPDTDTVLTRLSWFAYSFFPFSLATFGLFSKAMCVPLSLFVFFLFFFFLFDWQKIGCGLNRWLRQTWPWRAMY